MRNLCRGLQIQNVHLICALQKLIGPVVLENITTTVFVVSKQNEGFFVEDITNIICAKLIIIWTCSFIEVFVKLPSIKYKNSPRWPCVNRIHIK
jgi:hypothetical protein